MGDGVHVINWPCVLWTSRVAVVNTAVVSSGFMNFILALLLLVLCQYTAVHGFGISSAWPLTSRRSGYLRRNAASAAASRRTSRTRRDAPSHPIGMMSSFWEGIVQGIGGQTGGAASASAAPSSTPRKKCPVLICPAQLSVPGDYRQMVAEFKER